MIHHERSNILRHPEKRKTLIYLLSELSDPVSQRKVWLDGEDFPNVHGIDEVFHFFFDDSDLAKDSKSEVGWILENEEEAERVERLCEALEAMLDRLGDAQSADFMNDAQWLSVVELAGAALMVIKKQELGSE